ARAAPPPSCETASAIQEVSVRGLLQLEREAERPPPLGEPARRPAPLHDPEAATVGQRPSLLLSRLLRCRVRGVARAAVDQEDAAARENRRPDECPELVEPGLGHVREPEREEDNADRLLRPPVEHVGLDQLGVESVERERLRIRVDRYDPVGEPDELARPDPG